MRPDFSQRFLLHTRWLIVTAASALLCCGLYGYAVGAARPGGSWAGVTLGLVAVALIVFAACYGVRRRVGLHHLRDTIGRIDPEREKRLGRLNEAIADLQILGARRGDSPAQLRKAAGVAVKEGGLGGQIRVEVLADSDGKPALRLIPREHPGRLENWLLAHQYLGVLAVLLIALHAGFRFCGALAVVTTILCVATVLSGVMVSLLYVIGPRLLVRLETRGGKDEQKATVLAVAISLTLGVHVALTGALLGALVVHVLSVLYY